MPIEITKYALEKEYESLDELHAIQLSNASHYADAGRDELCLQWEQAAKGTAKRLKEVKKEMDRVADSVTPPPVIIEKWENLKTDLALKQEAVDHYRMMGDEENQAFWKEQVNEVKRAMKTLKQKYKDLP